MGVRFHIYVYIDIYVYIYLVISIMFFKSFGISSLPEIPRSCSIPHCGAFVCSLFLCIGLLTHVIAHYLLIAICSEACAGFK